MFELDVSKILVIGIVLIVVVGPKDLPRMLRQFGRTTSKLRAMAGDFRRQFDEALKEADLEDVAETLNSVRRINPMNEIRKHLPPIEDAGHQMRANINDVMRPRASPASAEASAEPVAAEPLKNGAAALLEDAVPAVAKSRPKRSSPAKAAAGKAASTGVSAPTKTASVSLKARPKPIASRAPTFKTAAAKASQSNPAPAKGATAKNSPPGRNKRANVR